MPTHFTVGKGYRVEKAFFFCLVGFSAFCLWIDFLSEVSFCHVSVSNVRTLTDLLLGFQMMLVCTQRIRCWSAECYWKWNLTRLNVRSHFALWVYWPSDGYPQGFFSITLPEIFSNWRWPIEESYAYVAKQCLHKMQSSTYVVNKTVKSQREQDNFFPTWICILVAWTDSPSRYINTKFIY